MSIRARQASVRTGNAETEQTSNPAKRIPEDSAEDRRPINTLRIATCHDMNIVGLLKGHILDFRFC